MPAEENVQAVLRSFELWNHGGVEAARPTWSDEPEWHDPPNFPDAGVHRGSEACAERLVEVRRLLPHRLSVEDAIPVGDDEVLLLVWMHGEGEHSGVPIDQPMGCIVRVKDGRISRWRLFLSHDEARTAAGFDS